MSLSDLLSNSWSLVLLNHIILGVFHNSTDTLAHGGIRRQTEQHPLLGRSATLTKSSPKLSSIRCDYHQWEWIGGYSWVSVPGMRWTMPDPQPRTSHWQSVLARYSLQMRHEAATAGLVCVVTWSRPPPLSHTISPHTSGHSKSCDLRTCLCRNLGTIAVLVSSECSWKRIYSVCNTASSPSLQGYREFVLL